MMSHRVSALIMALLGRLRDSLRVLLRATGRIVRVEQVDDARSGLQSITARPPGLVLLETDLGEDDARRALRQLKTQWPRLPCLVLVHNLEEEQVARAAGADVALQAGFATETFFSPIEHLLAELNLILSTVIVNSLCCNLAFDLGQVGRGQVNGHSTSGKGKP